MSPVSRILIAIASLSLIATYFLPFWFIHLIAPQYPEGLTMHIWLNKLTGQVEIINGLNHYIGMDKINEEMFPELKFMVYIVGFFIVFGLVIALTGNRKLLFVFLILTVLGVLAALADMYRWGYDYGHNLDPTAPIQVPGLSYQPPLIGHKKLLNFDAYSYPDTGGWVFAAAALVFTGVWFFEWRKYRKLSAAKRGASQQLAACVLIAALLWGCSAKPEKIAYGKDACAECRMTIMDPKFGAEVVTKKGKVYKFDDGHCVVRFLKSGTVKKEQVAQTVFINFHNPDNFLNVESAYFVVSPQLKSPMNSNAAAFPDKSTAGAMAAEVNGKVLDWPSLYNSL